MCEGWRGLAVRLGLATFVPDILCCREKCKLRILLDVWKEESFPTFTVDTLKTILCQEVRPVTRRPAEVTRLLQGHTDMYKWVCLMTASRPGTAAAASPFRRSQFSSRSFSVSRPRPQQPPLHRPVRSSPMRDFLYSPSTSSPTSTTSLLAPATLDDLPTNLGGVDGHDGVAGGLLVVVPHEGVALVFEVSHFQDPPEWIESSPERPLVPCRAAANVDGAVVGAGLIEHLIKVKRLPTPRSPSSGEAGASESSSGD